MSIFGKISKEEWHRILGNELVVEEHKNNQAMLKMKELRHKITEALLNL